MTDEATTSSSPSHRTWEKRLNAAREKGRTAREVAAEHGVTESTVYAWRRRIQGQARKRTQDVKGLGEAAQTRTAFVRFAKVERMGRFPSPRDPAVSEVVVELSGVRIYVRHEADVALATRMVQSLAKASL